MRNVTWLAVTSVMSLCLMGIWSQAGEDLKTETDRRSYCLGLDIGRTLKRLGLALETDLVVKGLKDALSESKPLMSDEEVRDTLESFRKELEAKRITQMREAAEENKKKGEAFLAANKQRKEVVTLPSGLQYEVIKEGTGRTPAATDIVSVHYRGTLIDGTEFDSSIRRGQPVTFPVNGVIKGWTEALQLMKVGAKWKLFIPAELAYGSSQRGPLIAPNSTLIFEVELLEIKNKD